VAPGVRLGRAPGFPLAYKAEAEKGGSFLEPAGAAKKQLNWTFLSPPALFAAGERAGQFRLGTDRLLTAADGKNRVSAKNFTVARWPGRSGGVR
jgi:uncharacterized protein